MRACQWSEPRSSRAGFGTDVCAGVASPSSRDRWDNAPDGRRNQVEPRTTTQRNCVEYLNVRCLVGLSCRAFRHTVTTPDC